MRKGFLAKKPTPVQAQPADPPTDKVDKKAQESSHATEYAREKVAKHCLAYTSHLGSVKPIPPVISHHMSKCNDSIPALEHKTNNISQLKYDFTLAKTKTATITIRAISPDAQAIIGFIHGDCMGKTFVPKLVSIGGSHTSTHGEVRKNIIMWKQFGNVWNNFTDMLTPVEQMTIKSMNKHKLGFQADFYIPPGSIEQNQLNEFVDNNRLAIKFFVCSWMFDYKYIVDKLNQKNLSKNYVDLIQNHGSNELWSGVDQIRYHDFMRACTEAFTSAIIVGQNWHPVGAVQKIRTISYAEITRVDDINMDLWRELYVMARLSELVINFVSPSFACLGNWFFIPNAHVQLFDSVAIREKYQQSDIANKIAEKLRLADEYNANATGPAADLVNQVHEAIAMADKEVRLTNMAACIISEWGGRTIDNAYAISDTKNANDNIIRTFSDHVYFAKHAFEILHACASMNNLGIAHGDMSTAKVTFQTQLKTYDHHQRKELFKNPLCVFEHGDTYLFPEDGSHFMIISMASALMEKTPQLDTDHGVNFVERYLSDQLPRACKQLTRIFGDAFIEANFVKLYADEPHKAFLSIAAADPYHFFNTLLINIAELPRKMPQESVKLCESIRDRALELFLNPELQNPSTIILQELFKQFRIGPDYPIPADALIFNVFRRDLPLTWNLADYDSWGPLINREIEFKLYRQIFGKQREDQQSWEKFMLLDEVARMNAIAKKYVESERGIIESIPFE